ncbi:MAG: hypothetical protein LBE89_01200 [Helicobacteraceae bacterium]|jgi:hypothetical protein|nr:hypothetical protein [Helicobacteraceae bacterium]
MRFLLLLTALIVAAASADQVQIRRFTTDTPPSAAIPSSGAVVIRRVYTRVGEANKTEPAYHFFVGAGFELFSRRRTVTVESKKTLDNFSIFDKKYPADGETYRGTQSENESSVTAEIGVLSGGEFYYGAKLGYYDDFTQLSAIIGKRLEDAEFLGFTPKIEAELGIGYDDFDSAEPDNFSLGVFAGVQRALTNRNLFLDCRLFYRHRWWSEIGRVFGDEEWQDGEAGAAAALRYLF